MTRNADLSRCTAVNSDESYGSRANLANISWLFVIFGQSHLEGLYFTDFIVRSPSPEIHSPPAYLS